MVILLVVVGVVAWVMAVAMALRTDTLVTRMIEQLNAESAPDKKISVFVNNWAAWDAVQRHRELHPRSELHRRFWIAMAIAFGSFAVMGVCWFSLLSRLGYLRS